jgi:hypothetical protein
VVDFIPKGSDYVSLDSVDPCSSCASIMRPTQAGIGGTCLVPDPATFGDSNSYKLRSPNLSVTKSRDHGTHLEPGRNLLDDWNAIDVM